MPRRAAVVSASPRCASISTAWAVTSADGGSMTAPKSQNGSLPIRPLVLSASKAAHPPSRDCMPTTHCTPRSTASASAGVPSAVAPAQREHDLRGVVDVGVDVVGELESPAGRGELGPAHRPVAGHPDLLLEQPVGGPAHDRVVRRRARVEQAGDGEAGVPDRRLARLEPAVFAVRPLLADEEPVQAGDGGGEARVLQRVAQQVQREDRVHPGRLDAAPAAVGLLAGEDPLGRLAHRQRSARVRRQPVVGLQGPVEQGERASHRDPVSPARPGTPVRSSATVNGSGRTGRSVATTVIGTTVCRAQHAQS